RRDPVDERPKRANVRRTLAPFGKIGGAVGKGEGRRKVKADQHVGARRRDILKPIPYLGARPDMSRLYKRGRGCAACHGQRNAALALAARARPVESGKMGETAHRQALAHVCHLAQSAIESHMHPMLIETESTPNPATLKFLPGEAVMEAGTRDFATPEEAEASPLATALFSLGDVTGVFFGRDFISVTIAPGAEWADVKPDVLGIIMDHFLAR